MDEQDILTRLSHPTRRFVWLKRFLSKEKSDEIQQLKLSGVYLRKEPRRVYPHGMLAAHILGFVGVDGEGLEGIEASFQGELAGENGFIWVLKDGRLTRMGIYSPEAPMKKSRDGATVYLTLDMACQDILETELDQAFSEYPSQGAAGVLIEVASGEVLAMASRPSFDPNHFSKYDPKTWRNRALADAYEQGSVMKPFIVAAALSESLVTPDMTIFCHNGACRIIHGRTLHDSHPYGNLTVSEVIIKSSNIGTALIGMKVGSRRLCEYLETLGFGKKTGIPLPGEGTGLLKPASAWTDFTLTSIPMGHEICVTPVQMAAAYTTLAGDGSYRRPSLVQKIVYPDGQVLSHPAPPLQRIYPRDAVESIQTMLRQVVERGTAKKADVPMIQVSGKTGTAQKLDETGHYSHAKYISVFVGFAPAEKPLFCCLVLLDEPDGAYYGGTVAAPAAGRILQRACLRDAISRQYQRISLPNQR
jgi:cell division protein FtsI (penicillin-binding protein 3)